MVISKMHTCKLGTFNNQGDQWRATGGLCLALLCIGDLMMTSIKRSRFNSSQPRLIPEESSCLGEDHMQQVSESS